MDQGVINAIDSVGFPIVCVCALAVVLWKMYCKMEGTLDRITETNKELASTNAKLVGGLKGDIDCVKEDITYVKESIKEVINKK